MDYNLSKIKFYKSVIAKVPYLPKTLSLEAMKIPSQEDHLNKVVR